MTISLARPYHWIISVWGERYCDYLLDYCLPSMLAPGNLPSVNARGSKLLIATTTTDWARMRGHRVMRAAAEHIEPLFIEVPPAPAGIHGCTHMGIGHKLATEIAFHDRAYAGVIAPDCLFSDGSIGNLARHAADGKTLVMVPACLRIAEEPFLAKVKAFGCMGWNVITATGRQLASAAITSLHAAALLHDWDGPLFGVHKGMPCFWLRVPGEDGIVIQCLSWGALMVDYGAMEKHDTHCLEHWTIDGDYAFRNLGMTKDIHVVTDSDEVFYAGFTPKDEQAPNLNHFLARGADSEIRAQKLKQLGLAFHSGLYDPLKQSIFAKPVLWHAREVNDRWADVEARTAEVVRQAMERPEEMAA